MPDTVVPVTCPQCQAESVARVPAGTLKRLLAHRHPLLLRSACHNIEWQASAIELEQIHEYLETLQWLWSRAESISPTPVKDIAL
jgi:hypothetical protein